MNITRIGLLATGVALMAPALTGAAAAAASEQILPPAGLYRIDRDLAMTVAGAGGIRQREDGTSGDAVLRRSVPGRHNDQRIKGNGPITHCVQPRASGAVYLPLPAAMAGCSAQKTTITKDRIVHTAHCRTGQSTLTIRRLDEDTWEYVTLLDIAKTKAAPTFGAFRPILEHAAKYAKTPEARAEAARQLAELPALQAQLDSERAAAIEKLEAAARRARTPADAAAARAAAAAVDEQIPLHASGREFWTRIADTCAAQARADAP